MVRNMAANQQHPKAIYIEKLLGDKEGMWTPDMIADITPNISAWTKKIVIPAQQPNDDDYNKSILTRIIDIYIVDKQTALVGMDIQM